MFQKKLNTFMQKNRNELKDKIDSKITTFKGKNKLSSNTNAAESTLVPLPPMENFIRIDNNFRLLKFFYDVRQTDILFGHVTDKCENGLFIEIVCHSRLNRNLTHLGIIAFCPNEELPSLLSRQYNHASTSTYHQINTFQVGDRVKVFMLRMNATKPNENTQSLEMFRHDIRRIGCLHVSMNEENLEDIFIRDGRKQDLLESTKLGYVAEFPDNHNLFANLESNSDFQEVVFDSENYRNPALLQHLKCRMGISFLPNSPSDASSSSASSSSSSALLCSTSAASTHKPLERFDEQQFSVLNSLEKIEISSSSETGEQMRRESLIKQSQQFVASGVKHFKVNKEKSVEAMQCYNKAIQICNFNPDAFVARGALHAAAGSYELAIRDFETALKLKPNHQNCLNYLTQTLIAYSQQLSDKNQRDEAESQLIKATRICPDNDAVVNALKRFYA